MIPWYFKLLQITHFVEPCVHVADSWSRIASAFDHHVDVKRLLDDEKSQVLAAKINKIKYRNRFENISSSSYAAEQSGFLESLEPKQPLQPAHPRPWTYANL